MSIFSAVIGVLLAANPAVSQSGTLITLQAPENVWDCAAEDLDQNGTGDLILVCGDERKDPPEKFLAVYLADENGGYPEAPSLRSPLDAAVGVLFLAEVDGKAPKEIVAASGEGADVFAFESGALNKSDHVACPSLFPTRAKSPSFVKVIANDLDGDGRDEWLVPVPQAYDVWSGGKRIAHVPCDVVSEMRRADAVVIMNRLPAVQTFDLKDNPGKAMAFLSDEFADFAYGKNWETRTRVRIPVNEKEKWDASAKMADINKDGFPDLMVTQTKGTVNLSSTTQIYIATEPMKFPEEPTATFTSEGSIASPSLLDVNDDDQRDMVVARIPFGVKNIVNYFVRRKVSVTAQVYLFDGKGFPTKPSYESDLTLDAPEGKEEVAYAMEDFTGDKRPDLCFSETHDHLAFYAGTEKGFLSAKPFTKIPLPSFGRVNALDLNKNDAKDVVLVRPSGDNQKRVDVILF